MQSNNKLNKGFLCLHLGAGFHSETKRDLYKKVCEDALQLGVNLLNNQSTCVEVVTKVTSFLENSQLTNAGFGSNLTINGTIECEAAIMESAQNRFGAVGCVKDVQNPIKIANVVLQEQAQIKPLGLVSPMVLVGNGAREKAKQYGIEMCDDPNSLVSKKALRDHKKFKAFLEKHEQHKSNTKNVSDLKDDIAPTSPAHSAIDSKTTKLQDYKKSEAHQRSQIIDNVLGGKKRKIATANSSSSHEESIAESPCKRTIFSTDIIASAKAIRDDDSEQIYDSADEEAIVSLKLETGVSYTSQVSDKPVDCDNVSGDETASGSVELPKVEHHKHSSVCSEENDSVCQGRDTKLKQEEDTDEMKNDTIGVICVDANLDMATAVSSGGLILKQSGRLGPCTQFGAGCWAFKYDREITIGSCCSGTGEAMMRTHLAENVCRFVYQDPNNITDLVKFTREEFAESRYLLSCLLEQKRQCGFLLVSLYRSSSSSSRSSSASSSAEKTDRLILVSENVDDASSSSSSTTEKNDNLILGESVINASSTSLSTEKTDHLIPVGQNINDTSSSSSNEKNDHFGQDEKKDDGRRRTGKDDASIDFYLAHTTDSFCVGYIASGERDSNFVMSRLRNDEDTSVKGFHFII